jgi:putative endonuclease
VGSPVGAPMEESHLFRMFYTYILKSLKDGLYYYGSTSNLKSRLKEHNYGHVKSTKGHRPYKIHYYEIFETKTEALKRELFFKSIDGYNWLKDKEII